MKRLLIILTLLSMLAVFGCGTTGDARVVGLLMGTSTKDAEEFLAAIGKTDQCSESYNISIRGADGVSRMKKVTIWYNCKGVK